MIVNEEACFFQKKLAESLKLLLLPHKKERLDICQDALFIQIEAIELLLLVPEDILSMPSQCLILPAWPSM
jgi:hypothetical protein